MATNDLYPFFCPHCGEHMGFNPDLNTDVTKSALIAGTWRLSCPSCKNEFIIVGKEKGILE